MKAFVGVFSIAVLAGTLASAQPLKPILDLEIKGTFPGEKAGEAAINLSGLACAPAVTGSDHACLAVDDEGLNAYAATLTPHALEARGSVPLPADAKLGSAPQLPCETIGKSNEFDAEGVAFDEVSKAYYVVGSNGCGRNSHKFKASAFQLARIALAQDPAKSVVTSTYRVVDVAMLSPLSPFVGKDLTSGDGLNIEGLAVAGDDIYLGLRAPVSSGGPYILKSSVAKLFADGKTPATAAPEMLPVRLPADSGIRDLALLDPTHMLVLYGPAQEQCRPYGVALFDMAAKTVARTWELADLVLVPGPTPVWGAAPCAPPLKRAKAESLTFLSRDAGKLKVLVMFDGPPNGRPSLFELAP